METNRKQLNDPIELLIQEHCAGLKRLDLIAQAAESIKTEGFSAKAFLEIKCAAEYLGIDMRQHAEHEEQFLFPLVDKYNLEITNVTRLERREMWQALNELRTSVRDVEEGRVHGINIRELVRSAQTVVEKFRSQIEKENTIIFPMVRRMLTADEYALLTIEITTAVTSNHL